MSTTTVVPSPSTFRGFAGEHVLSVRQYDRGALESLFEATDRVRRRPPGPVLTGRILVSAFFDHSTRTRLAHEAAMARLGGAVIGFDDPSVTRAGGGTRESSEDVVRMAGTYGDVVVVRHRETGWARRAAGCAGSALVVNGGDGAGHHPTQTMTDLYSMRSSFGSLDGLRILLVGDLRMRCARSLLIALRHFDCEVLAPRVALTAPPPRGAVPVVPVDDVREALGHVDVVYCSPTVPVSDPAMPAGAVRPLRLDRELLDACARGRRLEVMHPLPRTDELATDVDPTGYNAYWRTAALGVPVRMALLSLMLGEDLP